VTNKRDTGMTLIEVMIATFIITVGLLAVAAALGNGINAMFIVQEQLIAKQKAREALESVFTARSTQNIEFTDILGVSAGGKFLEGWQPIAAMCRMGSRIQPTMEPSKRLFFQDRMVISATVMTNTKRCRTMSGKLRSPMC